MRPDAGDQNALIPQENILRQLDRLFAAPLATPYEDLEALIVKHTFNYCDNNQVQTAKLLGISRNILHTLAQAL